MDNDDPTLNSVEVFLCAESVKRYMGGSQHRSVKITRGCSSVLRRRMLDDDECTATGNKGVFQPSVSNRTRGLSRTITWYYYKSVALGRGQQQQKTKLTQN